MKILLVIAIFVIGFVVCVFLLREDLPDVKFGWPHLSMGDKTIPVGSHRRAFFKDPEEEEELDSETITAGKVIEVLQLNVDPKRGTARVVARQVLKLPAKEWEYSAIIPPRGTTDDHAFDVCELKRTSTTATVSHHEPLVVYEGKDSGYYVSLNSSNKNKSRFMGEVVSGDIPLQDVLSVNSNNYKVLYLGDEALAFMEVKPQNPMPQTVRGEENPGKSEGRAKQRFQH